MCIAVLNTAGKLSKKTIQNCWSANSHGAGICHAENGKVVIFKELKDVNKLWNYYNSLRSRHEGNILLHFRIATHGRIDEANCHPFRVSDDMAFIHNGIISETSKTGSDYSDTWHFNEDILKKMPKGFLRSVGVHELLAHYIDYSKLVFLDGKDSAYIINEQMGIWDGANWFSNQSYKDRTFDSKPKYKSATKYNYNYNYGYNYDGGYYDSYGHDKDCELCGGDYNVAYDKSIDGLLCKHCVKEMELYGDGRI